MIYSATILTANDEDLSVLTGLCVPHPWLSWSAFLVQVPTCGNSQSLLSVPMMALDFISVPRQHFSTAASFLPFLSGLSCSPTVASDLALFYHCMEGLHPNLLQTGSSSHLMYHSIASLRAHLSVGEWIQMSSSLRWTVPDSSACGQTLNLLKVIRLFFHPPLFLTSLLLYCSSSSCILTLLLQLLAKQLWPSHSMSVIFAVAPICDWSPNALMEKSLRGGKIEEQDSRPHCCWDWFAAAITYSV